MRVEINPGMYVLAVSGGVDSMVLLDVLAGRPDVQLVVAHFDHGIRPDSAEDRRLVQTVGASHHLPFVFEEAKLGPHASEATARTARYDFLERTRIAHDAQAIVTAHHQDDLLETMMLNLLRGTGRRGLTSLRSTGQVLRPLLDTPKAELIAYGRDRRLNWREDSTNSDLKYRRNLVRQRVMPQLSDKSRQQLLQIHRHMQAVNDEIDALALEWLAAQPGTWAIDRRQFSALPHAVAREVMAVLLRAADVTDLNSHLLERLVITAKTARAGTQHDVDARHIFKVGAVHQLVKRATTPHPIPCSNNTDRIP